MMACQGAEENPEGHQGNALWSVSTNGAPGRLLYMPLTTSNETMPSSIQ